MRFEAEDRAGFVAEGDDAHASPVGADVVDVDDVAHELQHARFEIVNPDAAGGVEHEVNISRTVDAGCKAKWQTLEQAPQTGTRYFVFASRVYDSSL